MRQNLARRGFLRLLGGAVAAGPQAAKAAGDMTLADASLYRHGVSAGTSIAGPRGPGYGPEEARSMLDRLHSGGARARAMRRRRFHIDGLEPGIAPMRSLSLVTKVRMSHDRAFARYLSEQEHWLTGIVRGWWQE